MSNFLPPSPSLALLRNQAKQLLKAHKSGDSAVCERIRAYFPKLSNAAERVIFQSRFTLQDAQLVIAREYGFPSWSKLKDYIVQLRPVTPSAMESDGPATTPEWLTDRLLRNGHLPRGKVLSVETKKARSGSNPSFRLEVSYSPDAPESAPHRMRLKLHKSGGGDAFREGVFYKEIALHMTNPPIPHCYDVVIDYEAQQSHLLLADLSLSHHLVDWQTFDSFEPFEDIVDALLAVQTFWWAHPQLREPHFIFPFLGETSIPERIKASCRHLSAKALPQFVDRFGDRLADGWVAIFERVIAAWPDLYIVRASRDQAFTLTHTDFHPHNILMPRHPEGQLVLSDWESYTRGMGIHSLAHLLLTCNMPSERRQVLEKRLLGRYHAGLVRKGINDFSLTDCYFDYRLSILADLGRMLLNMNGHFLEPTMRAFKEWKCEELLR